MFLSLCHHTLSDATLTLQQPPSSSRTHARTHTHTHLPLQYAGELRQNLKFPLQRGGMRREGIDALAKDAWVAREGMAYRGPYAVL